LLQFPSPPFFLTGFILKNGFHITKKPLEKLLQIPKENNSEFNSLFHLTPDHLNVNFSEKMNVRLAAQTISRSVAIALQRYLANDPEAIELSQFILKMNDWFDIMNSHHTAENVPFKKPFSYSQDQIELLDEVYDIVLNMKRPGKNSIQVFQRGILLSISSLKILFSEMQRRYGIQYLLTYKVNQDILENFFGRIRCWGGTDHPSPMDCLCRIKLIILGEYSKFVEFEKKN
jgi:hypothetical protein